jgi:hypothetical protein
MKHYWLELPGPVWFSGAHIYRNFVRNVSGPAVAVELGAWKGRSASFMGVEIANSKKPIRFFTVDHFIGSTGEEGYDGDEDLEDGRLFEVFQRNIKKVARYVNVIREDSRAAADRFADESVDFLYVDASHGYHGVLGDLVAWYPKVKFGGIIAGDDWCFINAGLPDVRRAVLDFFGKAASHLTISPGSGPNERSLQWSIVKAPGLAVASPAAIRRAIARRRVSSVVAGSPMLRRIGHLAPDPLRSLIRERL